MEDLLKKWGFVPRISEFESLSLARVYWTMPLQAPAILMVSHHHQEGVLSWSYGGPIQGAQLGKIRTPEELTAALEAVLAAQTYDDGSLPPPLTALLDQIFGEPKD